MIIFIVKFIAIWDPTKKQQIDSNWHVTTLF